MIKIYKKTSKISENEVITILIEGHANYARYGYDIVCSAVSVLYQTMLLSIQYVGFKEIVIESDKDRQKVMMKNPTSEVYLFILFFFIGVKEIARSYPKYVIIQ